MISRQEELETKLRDLRQHIHEHGVFGAREGAMLVDALLESFAEEESEKTEGESNDTNEGESSDASNDSDDNDGDDDSAEKTKKTKKTKK